jgi:pimeloyl-ACP methyl ester carboxylesterase
MRLIFLHGGGLTSAMWRPQLDALSGEFDVSAVDLPGHGERADEKFTFPTAVDLVATLLSDGDPTILVGLSLGGYVSISLASDHPELPAALILTGCTVDYSRQHRLVSRSAELFQRAWPKRMLRNAQDSAFRKRYPDYAEDLVAGGQYWRGYADALRASRHIHWDECLAGYDRSVLVLNGALDRPHVSAQDTFMAQLQDGRAELVPDAGHLANLDQPEAYTAAVRTFAVECETDTAPPPAPPPAAPPPPQADP